MYPAGDPSLQTALLSLSKTFCVGGGSLELHLDKAWRGRKIGKFRMHQHRIMNEGLWRKNDGLLLLLPV